MYRIEAMPYFVAQLADLAPETVALLNKKKELLRIAPAHYKRIQHQRLLLFCIKFSDRRKEKRLIYAINRDKILLLFILDRENDYRDLDYHLEKIGY